MEQKRKRGRPPLGDRRKRRVCVQLDAETIERARMIGAGNVSAGLRQAVAAWIPKK